MTMYIRMCYCLTIWIKNPYGQHDAGCMDYDAPGHQSTQLDIIQMYQLDFLNHYIMSKCVV